MNIKPLLFSLALIASVRCHSQDVFTRALVLQTPAMEKVSVTENIVFKSVHDTTLWLDIYSPPAGSFTGDLPVVIFNNGVGSLDMPRWRVYKDWAKLIASNGMIAINYQARRTGSITDGEAAIDFVVRNAKQYHIDA